MRIITLRDEALFHLIRFLCRNGRRTTLDNVIYVLRLRYLTPEIRRVLRYAQDKRIIRVKGKRIRLAHDVEPIFTYFDPADIAIRLSQRPPPTLAERRPES